MRLTNIVPWTFGLLICCIPADVSASPVEDLRTALNEMHAWLGDDDRGQNWKLFLKSAELQALLAAQEADAVAIQTILDRYEGETPGLDRPQFVAVRDALRVWVQALDVSADSVDAPVASEAATPVTVHVAELNPVAAGMALPDLIRSAKGKVRVITSEEVAAAKAELMNHLETLNQFLDSGPQANADAWRSYLRWEPMQQELAKEKPGLATLNESLLALRGIKIDVDADEDRRRIFALGAYKDAADTSQGRHPIRLELHQFLEVRDALGRYMERVAFSSDRFPEAFDQRVDRLADLVAAYLEQPDADTARDIGRTLGFFERTGQVESVVAAVREQLSRPNLFVSASDRLVSSGVSRGVNQTQGISDNILGTSISGTTTLRGSLTAALVPNDDRAAVDLILSGNAVSNNVGYNSGLCIYGTAYSQVNGSKRVYFDYDGFTSDYAWASAPTSSNVHSIRGRGPLIRKIAWKRVAQSKGQAERIASGRASSRIAGGLDSQAAGQLYEANDDLTERVRAPLVRRDSVPALVGFRTTRERLFVKLLHASRGRTMSQIGAPGAPPELDPPQDLTAHVHESIVRNFSESLIGGIMLTDEQIVELHKEAELELPENLELSEAPDERWAITLNESRPIDVRFQDDTIKVIVQIKSLHRGVDFPEVKNVGAKIRVSADYQPNLDNGGFQLVRPEGDVKIEFLNAQGEVIRGNAQTIWKGIFQGRFNDMLGERLPPDENDGLELPIGSKRIRLASRVARSANGWLTLGWEQSDVRWDDGEGDDAEPDNVAVEQDTTEAPTPRTASIAR